MAIKQNYGKPPITEAVIEITFSTELKQKDFDKILKKFKKSHPNLHQINALGVNLEQRFDRNNLNVSQQISGFRLTTNDETDILIVAPNKLSIARLAPYLGWVHLFEKLNSTLKIWKSVCKTQPIKRIGIRYINRIDIPIGNLQKIKTENYLNIYPHLPKSIDRPMFSYVNQVTLPTCNQFWDSSITTANLISPLINHISLLLDIDVYRNKDIPIKDNDFLSILSEARDIKNDIFEECITPNSRKLFY